MIPLDLSPAWIIRQGVRVRDREDRARLSHLAYADAETRRLRKCRERFA